MGSSFQCPAVVGQQWYDRIIHKTVRSVLIDFYVVYVLCFGDLNRNFSFSKNYVFLFYVLIDDDDDDVDVTRGLSAAPQTLMKINKSNDATLIAFSDRWRIAIRLGMNFSNSLITKVAQKKQCVCFLTLF